MINIRLATPKDREAVENVCHTAFSDDEAHDVATLAAALLEEQASSETFTLLAEQSGDVIGAVGFSPVTISKHPSLQGYILAPLAVKPDNQKMGTGTALVNVGIQRINEKCADFVVVYGDPAYYHRFSFDVNSATQFIPPYSLTFPEGWQALSFNVDNIPDEALHLSCVDPLSKPELW